MSARTSTESESASVNPPQKAPDGASNFKNIVTIILVILLVGAAPAAYLYRDRTAKNESSKQQDQIGKLQQRVTELEAQAKANSANSTATPQTESKAPSAAAIENIKASITSNNTAALEGYMATSVKVIIAASEGIGDRTPTQAIGDLSYLDNATDPWNFELPEATLTAWRKGSYSQYFPTTAVVGKSLNNYVISFTFNSAGKINGIFMCVNADLLQQ